AGSEGAGSEGAGSEGAGSLFGSAAGASSAGVAWLSLTGEFVFVPSLQPVISSISVNSETAAMVPGKSRVIRIPGAMRQRLVLRDGARSGDSESRRRLLVLVLFMGPS
ncbi:MAG: hypothetical protein KA152_10965, partial [Verrucomicrobiales bacterium]|nr:hypothetical protein [Verrucomicrobiales bacterium]